MFKAKFMKKVYNVKIIFLKYPLGEEAQEFKIA